MGISKKAFGTTKDGKKATLYTLTNKKGMSVSFTDYGANIVSIVVPDKNGKMADVALGYDNVSGYEGNAPGYGSFIGRHGNRIANAEFTLNGVKYSLEKNDGKNNLHGGFKGYNKYFYDVETFDEDGELTIEFSRLSPDMEQGFPGNLDITVTYTLTNDNELAIEYFAVSDKDTLINFTNHSYFNLAGHASGDMLSQKVVINADSFTLTDAELIPTGEIAKVEGTPMDFRKPRVIGQDIDADYEPLKLAGGYDHNYVINNKDGEVIKIAELHDEKSGRLMEVFSDLPGMQLYSGNFIDGSEKGKEGKVYERRAGICFETQYFPNSCNIESFKPCVFKKHEEYSTTTIYRFSIR